MSSRGWTVEVIAELGYFGTKVRKLSQSSHSGHARNPNGLNPGFSIRKHGIAVHKATPIRLVDAFDADEKLHDSVDLETPKIFGLKPV